MRMKQSREFSRVKREGRRTSRTCLIANWMRLPGGSSSRLGIVTNRKVGPAVVRARARRLLRETFRLHQHDFHGPVALVLVAKPAIVGRRFQDVERDFVSAMRQAGLF